MDRTLVYPGSLPQDADLLNTNKNTMLAVGFSAQAAFGTSTVANGLVCSPTSPASMVVNVGPGSIISQEEVDATAYGSLPADTSDSVVKLGINLTATPFTLTAPGASGQSIIYLIEGQFLEQDGGSTVLPYYNPSNPAAPYSGPNNTGTSQNTVRQERVSLQLKAGTAANTGTETAPGVDAGWVGLYLITINNGQTTITSSSIAVAPGAPFIDSGSLLAAIQNAGKRIQIFTSSGTFTVPSGVTLIKVIVTGGGGGGANCETSNSAVGTNDNSGGGGGGGGTAIGVISVTPGASMSVTVGAGGVSQTTGGTSSFGGLSASGGQGASFSGAGNAPGGSPGVGTGGGINIFGGFGSDGQSLGFTFTGNGGSSYWGGGGRAAAHGGEAGSALGSGGGGAYDSQSTGSLFSGGSGVSGCVALFW